MLPDPAELRNRRYEALSVLNRKRPFEWLFTSVLSNARFRNLECTLCYEDFLVLVQQKVCHYCGIELIWPPHWSKGKISLSTNLDRKDNALGYTKDNCVVCCPRCNFGKGDRFTYEEWTAVGRALLEFRRTHAAK